MEKPIYQLTPSEKTFLENWKDQTKGPRWQFYALYIMAWSVVSFLVTFFLSKLFTNLWETGGPNLIYGMIVVSILLGIGFTHYMYVSNTRKYRRIIMKLK